METRFEGAATVSPDPIAPPWAVLPSGNPPFTILPEPAKIDTLLTEGQWLQLARHLHNRNDPLAFGMGWIGSDGRPVFARSKRQELGECIESSWRCIHAADARPFAVVAYCSNPSSESRWACIDIDAHSPGTDTRASWQAKRIVRTVQARGVGMNKEGVTVLLEQSGRGYHVFLIRSEFWPTSTWALLLKSLLNESFPDIDDHPKARDGIDLFPDRPVPPGSLGKGVRLPGTANPSTWNPAAGTYDVSRVLAHFNLDPLLAFLDEECNQRGSSFGYTIDAREVEPARGKPAAKLVEQKPVQTLKEGERLLRDHAITKPATRHNQLVALVSEGFYNFGLRALRSLAVQQYHDSPCPPASTLACHLVEFEEAYAWLRDQYDSRLSTEERRVFSCLPGESLREAFIIAQNFARFGKSKSRWGKDGSFPLSCIELGSRLALSPAMGDKLRKRLEGAGCLRRVEAGGLPNRANMYVWRLPLKDGR